MPTNAIIQYQPLVNPRGVKVLVQLEQEGIRTLTIMEDQMRSYDDVNIESIYDENKAVFS